MTPICMSEEYWANSMLSVVRYSGSIKMQGHVYTIVNKNGIDVFTLSARAAQSQTKVIAPGEPCDLLRNDFIPFYKKLGRDRFLDVLKEHQRVGETELKKIYKAMIAEEKACKAAKKAASEKSLFE